jgi:hypothetical protein
MHAKHADESVLFTGVGHPFDCQARLAEISQRAKLQTGITPLISKSTKYSPSSSCALAPDCCAADHAP